MRIDEHNVPKRSFPPLLINLWTWVIGLTLLSIVHTLTMTYIFKRTFPYGLPIFDTWDPYGADFTCFSKGFLHFHTPSFWNAFPNPFTYPAPIGIVFALLYKTPYPLEAYIGICLAALILGGWLLARALSSRGCSRVLAFGFSITILLTSWPVLLLLNRANIEGIVVIVMIFGVSAVLKEHWWTGAILIGIAGAMKIFPFVLLALLLSKRRYKEFVGGGVAALLVTLGGLEILGPNLNEAQHHILGGLLVVRKFFTTNYGGGFDHCLFSALKLSEVLINGYSHHLLGAKGPDGSHSPLLTAAIPMFRASLNPYLATVATLGILLYFVRIRKLPMLNQILALTICSVLLPPLSFDYTLAQLIFPFCLLCVYATDLWRKGESVPGLESCFICFAVIFGADTFLTLVVRLAGQVRSMVLVVLLIVVLRYRFAWWELKEGEMKSADSTVLAGNESGHIRRRD